MVEIVWGLSGVDTPTASATRKPKSISYSGCWTCRERRIKCDERPLSCRNCEKSKRICAGYDVRLRWPSSGQDGTAPASGPRRRIGNSAKQKSAPDSNRPLPAPLSHSDASDTPSAGSLLSALQVHLASPPEHPSPSGISSVLGLAPAANAYHSDKEEGEELAFGGEAYPWSNDASDTPTETIWSPAGMNSIDPVSNLVNTDQVKCAPERTRDSSYMFTVYDADVIGNAYEQPDRCPNGLSSLVLRNLHLDTAPNAPRELPLIMFGDSATALLIHHYTMHMVSLLQPVSHVSNPFRTIYLQLALEGSDALRASGASGQITLARISVFHSVLASAAVNLQSLILSQANYFCQLACYHRREALKAARDALADRSSSYKELMTAILSLVSVDISDGGTHDHWIHLEAATQLQKSRQKSRLVGSQTRQLNAMCRMLGLFARTALYEPNGKPWTGSMDTGDNSFDDLGSSIEFVYGITSSLAKAISDNHELASYLAFYNDDYPESLLEACEAMHDYLIAWDIESVVFSSISADDGPALGVAKAQVSAFYNALLIYHYRSVQRCEREELSTEQREVLKALNLAEDIKAKSQRQDHWAAPITWPAFIASCEAVGEFRQQWATWWDQIQTYGVANYAKQKWLVHQIWSKQDDADGKADWREILFDMNVRIIPV